jgi:hypothetical protein
VVNASGIERFVRDTLGCGCPDEVFDSISIRKIPTVAGRSAHTELLVGSRLLIQVLEAPRDTSDAGWLERVVADGRAVRDRNGYNRYRLVLVVPAPGGTAIDRNDLSNRFARASTGDDRAHLHLLTSDQLPASLHPPATGPSRPPEGEQA